MRLCTNWWLGLKRRVWPPIATSPVFFCIATTASASFRLSARGISTCTCLPASRHCSAWAACIWVGVARMTASRPGSFRAVGEIGRHVADAVLFRRLLRLVEFASDERDDLDPVDQLDAVEMLEAEGAGARERDFDGLGHEGSRGAVGAIAGSRRRVQRRAPDVQRAARLRRAWVAVSDRATARFPE